LKERITEALEATLSTLVEDGQIPADHGICVQVTRTRDRAHGDFTTNLAMQLAGPARSAPRALAARLQQALTATPGIAAIEIAGPGFLNFRVATGTRYQVLTRIERENHQYGRSGIGKGTSVQVEFVSANPTGPLHVGHGRGAAYGATVADLLEFCGYQITREYYVNDAGRQMNILAASVWLRYLELQGVSIPFPSNGYRGDYVLDIARTLSAQIGATACRSATEVLEDLPPDEPDGGDRELYIDAVIARCRLLLGPSLYATVFAAGLDAIRQDIEDDLADFGVRYQNWFSENSLATSGAIATAIAQMQERGCLYENDGALWFRSTDYGDDKDRVVRRENGEYTYFASDIAYHQNKFTRGFDRVINIWGADHHGYVARVKAALQALGIDERKLDVLLVQFAILYRGETRVQMSTRSGSFVTLRELRTEVGRDAARFFYVQRRCDQHLDFDLELAKRQSNDNPVYYIQYAHARICSVERQAESRSLGRATADSPVLERLALSQEIELLALLEAFPERIEAAALAVEPHQIAQYLRDLAAAFHAYYNAVPFMQAAEEDLIAARLALIHGIRQVLANGLTLLGVEAPENM
jgi:arginyl-tRNA synthetase